MLCVAASIVWLGAAPIQPAALVVVFPLQVNGDADREAGSRLSVILAQQLAENGIAVRPAPPGTQRVAFLDVARSLGVDYYVTGFMTPIGNEVSVVEQVVSTVSGTVVFSNTAQLLTYADAAGQGALLAGAIARHAGRVQAQVEAPPKAAATPEPSKTNEANLTGLFRRKPKAKATDAAVAQATGAAATDAPVPVAAATPSPSPTAAPAARSRRGTARATPAPATAPATAAPPTAAPPTATPGPAPTQASAPATVALKAPGGGLALFDTGGSATAARRSYALKTLADRLTRGGQSAVAAGTLSGADLTSRSGELCGQTGAKSLVGADLSTRDGDLSFGPATIASLDITLTGCDGTVILTRHIEREGTGSRNADRAIERAAAAAADAIAQARR